MRKKMICILMCTLLIAIALVNIPKDSSVKASGEGGDEDDFILDYDYIWWATKELCNVTYDAYPLPDDIPKGRSYGSKGGIYTVEEILEPEMNNMGLSDVHTERLGYINETRNGYSSLINVTDFSLTVYTDGGPNYPYANPIPKEEMFVIANKNDSDDSSDWTANFTLDNVTIIPHNFSKFFPLAGTIDDSISVSNYKFLSDYQSLMIGNVTYIDSDDSVPGSDEQLGNVFLFDDIEETQDKLDNLTDSEGAIIIDSGDEGIENVDATNYSFSVVCIDENSGENVKQLLENYTVLMDNADLIKKKLTFSYNLCGWFSDSPHVYIDRIPKHLELWKSPGPFLRIFNIILNLGEILKDLLEDFTLDTLNWNRPNFLTYLGVVGVKAEIFRRFDPMCKGIILYDSEDYHYMVAIPNALFPYFTVNYSVGNFLSNNADTTTISGYANQEYLEETEETPGAIGDNILGNITIDKSPEDAIAIVSNRYDGMWGQTPGDSGVGGAIVLGIAKYFKDHDITPKYNLTFLFTTAEENGLRGARHYNYSHVDDPIKYWLMLDQLAFDQSDAALCAYYNTSAHKNIIETIVDESQYTKRGRYEILPREGNAGGSEQGVASGRGSYCNTFCLVKDQDRRWDHWHRTGCNYTKGDCLNNTDRDDVNDTADLTLDIIKYFMVNPNCWFNGSIAYESVDSPYDSDSLNDSINATIPLLTSLPHDKLRIKAILKNSSTNATVFWKNFDFNITKPGVEKTITLTLPPSSTGTSSGNYKLRLELYNSTGKIDDIIGNGIYNDSDTQTSPVFLYPRGNNIPDKPNNITGPNNLQVFVCGDFSTNATDSNQDQLQYQWAWRRDKSNWEDYGFDNVGPYDSGETCNITHMYLWRGSKTIQVRARDDYGYLYDGASEELNQYGNWSNWSEPFDVTVTFFSNFDMSCTVLASPHNALTSSEFPSILVTNSVYNAMAFGGSEPYTYNWDFGGRDSSQEKKALYSFNEAGNETVSLNVTDNDGAWDKVTITVEVLNLSSSFNSSNPVFAYPHEIINFNDTSAVNSEYHITNWTWDFGDGSISYDQNMTHTYTSLGVYNVTLTVTDNQSGTDVYNKFVTITYDSDPPEITHVTNSPDTVGFGFDVMIAAIVTDDVSGVDNVSVNITYPDESSNNYTMTHVINDTYCYLFNDTWQNGVYNYSIFAVDNANNTNSTSGFNFMVSGQANISVCTTEDEYGNNENINLTDPPVAQSQLIGNELLDGGDILHIWNRFDSYYFDTENGIQLSNHYNEYWSKNVLMLGYYNNNKWNLIYRTDELSGFNKKLDTDDETYVNVTVWKDLTYSGYNFRLAIRYHLGVDDNELTVIPYIKNLGKNIPYKLGFGWEMKDIQIDMTPDGDYIDVDRTIYYLNQTLDITYTELSETAFYLIENITSTCSKSLYLKWDESLTYKLQVKSRAGQYNAPVTLFVRIGTLDEGQEKYTKMYWYDSAQTTYYFNNYSSSEAWEIMPENMVDGEIFTEALTTIDGDIELCDNNTCTDTNLGTISKVEIRAFGFSVGDQRDIILRPIFGGTSDGDDYTYETTEIPEWSQWFDITNDQGRGGGGGAAQWNWSEVSNLDCDVEAEDPVFGWPFTLICSKVELRVTYNNAPVVSNPYPPDGSKQIGLEPTLNITVSDPDGDNMDITWYSNSTLSMLTLRPNANGSVTELEKYPSSRPANYACVDEEIADDSDYVKWKGTSWKKDTYNLSDHSSESGTIHEVTVHVRCARIGSISVPTTNSSAKIVLRSGGSYYNGSEFKPPYSAGMPPLPYTNYSHSWTDNPATGNPWTWSAIDSLQAGIAFIGNQGQSECTHLYVTVNYTNPSTWHNFGTNNSVVNGTYYQVFSNASVNGQWWYWKVKVDDGTTNVYSDVYKFYTGNQSKIANTGSTDIKGYLLIQVQYYNNSSTWIVADDTVNETTPRTINSSEQFGLDTVFNGLVNTQDLSEFGNGTYRIYAAFRDPDGDVLVCDDENELVATYEFEITF